MIRRSLRQAANLRDFLQNAVPNLVDGFDFSRAVFSDREFYFEGWRRREADLPFEIPYRNEQGLWSALVYVLLEHQSQMDQLMPLRLFLLVAGCWARQLVEWEASPRQDPFELRPVLPIVLYTGPGAWNSSRTLADLMPAFPQFHRYLPDWKPVFWSLGEHGTQELLAGGPWLQLMAVMRAEDEAGADRLDVFRQASLRVAPLKETEEVRWAELLRMLLSYTTWRRTPAERDALVQIARETNPTREEEVKVMAQTIAEAWMEEGHAKGLTEGLTEGQLKEARTLLRQLLEGRFGALPEALVQQINATTELARLHNAVLQILRIGKLEDLTL
jgi:hypothetical protein